MQNLQIVINQETIAGVVIGTILFGALATSRLFRNLLLAAAATLIVVVYFRFGIQGLLKMWSTIVADSVRHELFALGFSAGFLIAAVMLRTHRPRHRRR